MPRTHFSSTANTPVSHTHSLLPAIPPATSFSPAHALASQMHTCLDLDEYLRLSNGVRALEYAEYELGPRTEELYVLRNQLNKSTKEISRLQHRR
jgi:hypothetical protein